jgi:hypothetical protein
MIGLLIVLGVYCAIGVAVIKISDWLGIPR